MSAKAAERKTVAVLVDYMDLFARGYKTEFRQLFENSRHPRLNRPPTLQRARPEPTLVPIADLHIGGAAQKEPHPVADGPTLR